MAVLCVAAESPVTGKKERKKKESRPTAVKLKTILSTSYGLTSTDMVPRK